MTRSIFTLVAVGTGLMFASIPAVAGEIQPPTDINRDGEINAVDVQLVINATLGQQMTVKVPDLVGEDWSNKKTFLKDEFYLNLKAEAVIDSGTGPGEIIEQDNPPPGTEVEVGETVYVTVSLGPSPDNSYTEIPLFIDFVNEHSSAVPAMESVIMGYVGYIEVEETEVASTKLPGFVVTQNPSHLPNEHIIRTGTKYDLFVSSGLPPEEAGDPNLRILHPQPKDKKKYPHFRKIPLVADVDRMPPDTDLKKDVYWTANALPSKEWKGSITYFSPMEHSLPDNTSVFTVHIPDGNGGEYTESVVVGLE